MPASELFDLLHLLVSSSHIKPSRAKNDENSGKQFNSHLFAEIFNNFAFIPFEVLLSALLDNHCKVIATGCGLIFVCWMT